MAEARKNFRSTDPVEQEAANWVWRYDRGLTAAEQGEFSSWLAASPQHGEQFARHCAHWRRLDGLANWRPEHGAHPNMDLLAPLPKRPVSILFPAVAIAVAAAVVALAFYWRRAVSDETNLRAALAGAASSSTQRILPDGSIIELNARGVHHEAISIFRNAVMTIADSKNWQPPRSYTLAAKFEF